MARHCTSEVPAAVVTTTNKPSAAPPSGAAGGVTVSDELSGLRVKFVVAIPPSLPPLPNHTMLAPARFEPVIVIVPVGSIAPLVVNVPPVAGPLAGLSWVIAAVVPDACAPGVVNTLDWAPPLVLQTVTLKVS